MRLHDVPPLQTLLGTIGSWAIEMKTIGDGGVIKVSETRQGSRAPDIDFAVGQN
jgi:hypothetical protein